MQVVLKIVTGRFADSEYAQMSRALTWLRPGQSLVVGRSRSKADFVVASDRKMSGQHFELSCLEDRCLVRDLGSSNGTTVDDQTISEAEVSDGDLIQAGETLFQVRVSGIERPSGGPSVDAAGPAEADLHGTAGERDSLVVSASFADLLGAIEPSAQGERSPVDMEQVDASSQMQVVLKIQGGPFGDAEFADVSRILYWIGPGQTLKVGRHRYEADVVVARDEMMSSLHFEISCDGKAAAVRDLNATNGTRLNREQVELAALRDGDEITAGATTFAVRITGAPEVPPVVAPAETPEDTLAEAVAAPSSPPAAEPVDEEASDGTPFEVEKARPLPPLRRPMKVVLKVKSGALTSVDDINLTQFFMWIRAGQSIKVGRSAVEADLPVEHDANMAPLHFELSCDGTVCRIRDLKSAAGTWVNGRRVVEALLRDADEIVAGETTFQVGIIDAPAVPHVEEPEPAVQHTTAAHQPPAIAPTPEIINTTPFTIAPFASRVGYPDHSLTLVVKGTFTLRKDHAAKPADEQAFPTGDLYYPDDDDRQGSVWYESDFAPVKPQADLLLVGTCYAPGGQAASQCDVAFSVGSVSRALRVFGDRTWEVTKGGGTVSSDPIPFTQMPLRYENSFGGARFAANPCGKGHRSPDGSASMKLTPLPNIEDPARMITGPGDEPPPAGFGPVSRNWSRRTKELGTYDDRWLKTRWPWFPEDFQWTAFNAAESAQRSDVYLRGDEEILLRNLHPQHSEFRSQLPGLRVRCFLDERLPGDASGEDSFREVQMNADTLWVNADAEHLVLVWRGVAKVSSAGCPELRRIFVAAERLDRPTASLDDCRSTFMQVVAEREAEFDPQPEAPLSDADEQESMAAPDAKAASENEFDVAHRDALASSDAQLRATLVNAGIDPDHPPRFSEADLAEAKAKLKQQGHELPEDEEDQQPTPSPHEAAFEHGEWTRERVIAHLQDSRSLRGEDLRELDLSEIDFSGADLSDCLLSGTKLVSARLQAANMERAVLNDADLTRAELQGAQLLDAYCADATFDAADLGQAQADNATFAGCSMRKAMMKQFAGVDVNFCEADLTEATFVAASLHGADFSKCQLHDCSFQQADLTGATFSGSHGLRIDMTSSNLTKLRAGNGCNFSQGIFHNAVGPDSTWTGGDFSAADFSSVEMTGVDFTGACLRGANLHAANLKFGRLAHVDLSEALLTQMNLFEGSLESANLTSANLSGSNMYSVEFVNALLDQTRLKGTNLMKTKLQGTLF